MSFFAFRKVEMTDGSELYEVITPSGERVASSTDDDAMSCLEMDLNSVLTDAVETNADVIINA